MKELKLIDNRTDVKYKSFYQVIGLIFNVLTLNLFFDRTYMFFDNRQIYLNRKILYNYIKENGENGVENCVDIGDNCKQIFIGSYKVTYIQESYKDTIFIYKGYKLVSSSYISGNGSDTKRYNYILNFIKNYGD